MTRISSYFSPSEIGDLTHFTIGDMLMPAALLEETDWRTDPMVVYSERRARRPVRFLLTRLFELVLMAGLALMAAHIFYRVLFINRIPIISWHEWFMAKTITNRVEIESFIIPEILMPYLYGGFIFLLLRYHLFANDQSNHMKNMTRERLGELLLTHLGRDEFFLHHMLMFCRRYRVIVGWAVVWASFIAMDVVKGGWAWVQPEIYAWLFMTLYVVLIVWIAGVLQYVIEWQWFAGGRGRKWRFLVSLLISTILSLLIEATVMIWGDLFRNGRTYGYYEPAISGPIAASVLFLALALVVTYPKAYFLYGRAEVLLRRRYDPE